MMKPILFNTDMVRAILDGRKTVTRRCVKYKYSNTEMKMRTDKHGTRLIEIQRDVEGETFGKNPDGSSWHKLLGYIEPRPPYKRGDVLYVRETFCALRANEEGHIRGHDVYYYKADGDLRPEGWKEHWHPSIHMPKEAARIFLHVADMRVERLQDMSYMDFLKEGIVVETKGVGVQHIAEQKYRKLWNSTIPKKDLDKYGWDANPWVWVIEFERCESPENEKR